MSSEPTRSDEPADEVDLPLVREEVHVGKRTVITGRTRVRTVTDTVDHLIRQDLHGEQVDIERVPVDRLMEPGEAPPQMRTEGNVTVLPVLEEVLVVEKRLLIKEELRITRLNTHEIVEFPVTLRKQRAMVEQYDQQGNLITDPSE